MIDLPKRALRVLEPFDFAKAVMDADEGFQPFKDAHFSSIADNAGLGIP